MSTCISAHHSWGLAVRKAAVMSMAQTKQMRTAILRAHVGSGSICTGIPSQISRNIIATLAHQQSLKRTNSK
jgi:hypothetical protein